MRKTIITVSIIVGLGMLITGGQALAADPSQTAQSVMVRVDMATAYEIEGTITWTFDRGNHREPGTAMEAYTNVRTAGPTFVGCSGNTNNCGTGNAPLSTTIAAAEPAPNEVKLQQHAQDERCTFFWGGTLTGTTYTDSATVKGQNGSGNWTYRWTYTIAPDPSKDIHTSSDGVQVGPYTAWTSDVDVNGGTVDIPFSGFVASESFLNQPGRKYKYSFTMLESGVTRARNVWATLQKSDGYGGWINVATANLNDSDLDSDLNNDALSITPAAADFQYFGNDGGPFGNSAVFAALHYAGGKAENGVVNILNGSGSIEINSFTDNFAGNNNDLAAGNVHLGLFDDVFAGLTEPGDYRIVISGVLKGNSASPNFSFNVASDLAVIGGCTVPE